MKRHVSFSFLFLLYSLCISGQEYQMLIDSFYAVAMSRSVDSGLVIAGNINLDSASTQTGIKIIRINSIGNIQSVRKLDTPNSETVCGIEERPNKSLIIAGNSTDFSTLDTSVSFLLSMDSLGNINWQRCFYDGLLCTDMLCLTTGEILIYGECLDSIGTCFISKNDSTGNPLWIRIFFGSDPQVIELKNGNYLLGMNDSNIQTIDLIRLDTSGNVLLSEKYIDHTNFKSRLIQMREIYDNGIGLLENISSAVSTTSCGFLKLDSAGAIEWTRKYFKPGTVYPLSFTELNDNSLLLSGCSSGDHSSPGFYFINLDTTGNFFQNYYIRRIDMHFSWSNSRMNLVHFKNHGFSFFGSDHYPNNQLEGTMVLNVDSANVISCSDTVTVNQLSPSIQKQTYTAQSFSRGFSVPCSSNFINSTIVSQFSCGATGLESLNIMEMSIYPNPANRYITLSTNKEFSINEVEIYNSVGSFLGRIKGNWEYNQTLDLSRFDEGLYFLKCYSGQTFILTEKLIIIR